jgi:transposase InsO family protein
MIPTFVPAGARRPVAAQRRRAEQLLAVSAATIDRMLADVKVAAASGRHRRAGFYSAIRREVRSGYFHLDIGEMRTEEGKLYLFVLIDRTSGFAYAELHAKANRRTANDFLKAPITAVPYKIHTVLTDNGIQFTDLPTNRLRRVHMFDMLCDGNDIEHRLIKPNHPWINGQVERMNRTLKEATVQRYHYYKHADSPSGLI